MAFESETARETCQSHGRPSWDTTWLAVSQTVAYRSRCDKRQVGAVIVTRDERPVIASYNGPARGQRLDGSCLNWCPRAQQRDLSPIYASCPSIHAEANALIRASYTDIRGGTIYVSSACCMDCAKLIANSGLKRVVHVVSDTDVYREPETVEQFLRECGLVVMRASRVEEL